MIVHTCPFCGASLLPDLWPIHNEWHKALRVILEKLASKQIVHVKEIESL